MTSAAHTDMTLDLAMDLAQASFTLAQRFSTGATMWCIAPACSPHAQHIAVEFVHPVVVGKRALPAVASLLDVRQKIAYEGQAAIELEVLAASANDAAAAVPLQMAVDGCGVIDPAPMITMMVRTLNDGADRAGLALAFHHAVAQAVSDVVRQVAGNTSTVGLTGGVFQNVLLLQSCRRLLENDGFTVLTHRVVPPNDGGVSLGQAAIATLTALDEARTDEARTDDAPSERTTGCV